MSEAPISHQRGQEFKDNQCQEAVLWGDAGMHFHQCLRTPQKGSEYCWQHQPERMEARRQAMIDALTVAEDARSSE